MTYPGKTPILLSLYAIMARNVIALRINQNRLTTISFIEEFVEFVSEQIVNTAVTILTSRCYFKSKHVMVYANTKEQWVAATCSTCMSNPLSRSHSGHTD